MTGVAKRVLVQMSTWDRMYLIDLLGQKLNDADDKTSNEEIETIEGLLQSLEEAVGR